MGNRSSNLTYAGNDGAGGPDLKYYVKIWEIPVRGMVSNFIRGLQAGSRILVGTFCRLRRPF